MTSMLWTGYKLEVGIRVLMKYFRFRACVIRWPDLCELFWFISHKTQFFPPNSSCIQDPVSRCYSFQLPSRMRILNGWVYSMAVSGSYDLHSSMNKDNVVPQVWYLLWLLLSCILSPHFCYLQDAVGSQHPPGVFLDDSLEAFAFRGAQSIASSDMARFWMLFLENHGPMLESVSLSEIPL